ncbi:MAG: hypothetical protein RBT45_00995 [Acholeplasmataceae bacterium]|jgi:hypothetical protein|nr:hypothetical protein [Acholeplasmataceae bacterium]
MKKFLIIYSIIALVIAIALYFVTLVVVTMNRNQDVFDNLSNTASETEVFDDFIKYQSIAHKKIDQFETDNYHIQLFHIISESKDETFDQIVWIIYPKNDVDYATSVSDEDDQTRMILVNNDTEEVFYESNSDPEYKDFAFSYGIEKYGFYFHAPVITQSVDLTFTLYNYHLDVIYEDQVLITIEAYDPENLGDFLPSFTDQEKEELLNIGGFFPQALVQNYTVYVLFVLITGFLVVQIKKKKWMS